MKKLFCILLSLCLVGCTMAPGQAGAVYPAIVTEPLSLTETYQARDSQPIEPALIQAIQQFGWDSSTKLLNGQTNDNYSPLSLYLALTMVAQGAKDKTAQELLTSLNWTGDQASLAQAVGRLQAQLNVKTETGRLQLANSFWSQQNLPIEASFIDTLTKQLQASIYSVDFADDQTIKQMSDWVDKQTEGLIKPNFESLSDVATVLLNTIYYKDSWQESFQADNTKPGDFHSPEGVIQKDYLQGHRLTRYINQDGIEGLVLPLEYGQITIVKKSGYPPTEILQQANLTELIQGGELALVQLKLPKFKFGNSYDLIDLMKQLGVYQMFDPDQANFSGLSSVPMSVSQIRQDSQIGLDEDGIEAAAMTSVITETAGGPIDVKEVQLTFDKPFLYLIQSPEGIPLFIGTVSQ